MYRRMANTCEIVSQKDRDEVVDKYAQKLLNSGHKLEIVRKVIIAGLKYYERKRERCAKPNSEPFHRSAEESGPARRLKKLTGKSSWFKGSKVALGGATDNNKGDVPNPSQNEADSKTHPGKRVRVTARQARSGPEKLPNPKSTQNQRTKPPPKELKIRTVLFVEQSRGGSLAKAVKGVVDRIAPIIGYKIKVQERGGTKLQDLLSNKNLWAGSKCGRVDCTPCKQTGNKTQDCMARNILYESMCNTCNPGGVTGQPNLRDDRLQPSIYVGESSRSLKERSKEHHRDYTSKKEDSHMYKHCTLSHDPTSKPTFNQYVVGKYKTSLERQIAEAVRIGKTLTGTRKCGMLTGRKRGKRVSCVRDWQSKGCLRSWMKEERRGKRWQNL